MKQFREFNLITLLKFLFLPISFKSFAILFCFVFSFVLSFRISSRSFLSSPTPSFLDRKVIWGNPLNFQCNELFHFHTPNSNELSFFFFSNDLARTAQKNKKNFKGIFLKNDELNENENKEQPQGIEKFKKPADTLLESTNIQNTLHENTEDESFYSDHDEGELSDEEKALNQFTPLGLDWEKAFDILDKSKEVGVDPKVLAINAALSTYERNGLYEDALELFDQMKKNKLKPDRVSYTLVMSACEKAHMFDKLMDIYNEMRRNIVFEKQNETSSKKFNVLNNKISDEINERINFEINVYEIMLNCCSKEGKGKEAVKFFEEMKQILKMQKISYAAYANVISACESEGMYDSALNYFFEMQQNSIPLTLFVINKIFSVYDKLNMADEAIILHNKMKEKYKIAEDINTLNYLLNIFAKCLRINDMENLWLKLLSGYKPENKKVTVQTIVAEEIDEIIFPNAKSYEACLQGYALTNNAEKAVFLLNEILENKAYVGNNLVNCHLALEACVENGQSDIALNILRKMQQHQIKLSVHTYNLVMKSCAASENWKLLLSLFYELMTKYITDEKANKSNDSLRKNHLPKLSFYATIPDKCVALSLGLKALTAASMYSEAKKIIKFIKAENAFASNLILRKAIEIFEKKIRQKDSLDDDNIHFDASFIKQSDIKNNDKHFNTTNSKDKDENEKHFSFSPFSSFIPQKKILDNKINQQSPSNYSPEQEEPDVERETSKEQQEEKK